MLLISIKPRKNPDNKCGGGASLCTVVATMPGGDEGWGSFIRVMFASLSDGAENDLGDEFVQNTWVGVASPHL
jgi:hypothetical protein